MYAYFIDVSQGSVETHLRCGGMYNNYIIANCLLSEWVSRVYHFTRHSIGHFGDGLFRQNAHKHLLMER